MKSTLLKVLALVVPPLAIFTPQFFAATDLSVGEISDRYFGEVLLIPSGWAFSIWGLIYLGVLTLAVVQILPRFDEVPSLRRARLPLIVNMGFNFAWLVTWQSLLFEIATVILIAQLASGIWLYYALAIPHRRATTPWEGALRFPFRVYVGWLTLATVIGIASLLTYWGWDGFGLTNAVWTVIMLIVSSAIGLLLTWHWRDPVYPAVFVWAFVAVALRPDQAELPIWTALVLAAVFLFAVVLMTTANLKTRGEKRLLSSEPGARSSPVAP